MNHVVIVCILCVCIPVEYDGPSTLAPPYGLAVVCVYVICSVVCSM